LLMYRRSSISAQLLLPSRLTQTGEETQRTRLATLLSDPILIGLISQPYVFVGSPTLLGSHSEHLWEQQPARIGLLYLLRSSADTTISALNKPNFPKLRRKRALSQSMLNALNKSDGPSGENSGYERWNRWSTACLRSGITLEDCTGQTLGTLPQDD